MGWKAMVKRNGDFTPCLKASKPAGLATCLMLALDAMHPGPRSLVDITKVGCRTNLARYSFTMPVRRMPTRLLALIVFAADTLMIDQFGKGVAGCC
jgi:hypothetical protein